MGTYSMILTKAAFFHRKYLDLYTHKMPTSIHDYVSRERLTLTMFTYLLGFFFFPVTRLMTFFNVPN
jgi:hypothetical protein